MSAFPTYESDSEFQKLLARRSDVDLTAAALEFARDAYPQLEFEPTMLWIADRASELSGPVARAKSERDALEALARCLAEEHGLHGDGSHFDDPDCSFLNRVIETGRGIPISLSVVYMAVADRVGIELKGVAAPGHFLTRCDTPAGVLFLDPFHAGRIMLRDEALAWLSEQSDLSRREVSSTLGEASPRAIIIRMLNNLKVLYARTEDWPAAWQVQHRLSALHPGSYPERRDLAILSVRAKRSGIGMDLLQSCLADCPSDDRADLERFLKEAQSDLARWN
ncbi:MAG: transglutaminase family protein [Planctomycetaceae bacterium]|nr:transglutaminase family protein [Planctomycetaceae bacterium]